MTCPHCAATMFPESSVHYHQSADYTLDQTDRESVCRAWHCLTCGHYVDAVVLANRARQADELRLLAQADAIVQTTSRRLHDYGVGPRA